MKTIADFLVYFAARSCLCIVQALSIEACGSLARGIAFLAADVFRLRGRVVDENIRHVFPDLTAADRRRLTRAMWEHLVLLGCEIAHVPRKIHDTNWRDFVSVWNKRQIVSYFLDPRPLVVVSGHYGNFEFAGYMTSLFGFRTHTVARRLDNPFLDRWLNGFREKKGQFMLPKEGSADQVGEVLGSGGTLVLLGDQHAGPKGCWVDFLGRPASCHKAIALFPLASGAPLVVAYARRRGRPMSFEMGLKGAADPRNWDSSLAGVRPLTEWYNRMLAELIRRDPEQYWWLHRRWREPPAKRRRAA